MLPNSNKQNSPYTALYDMLIPKDDLFRKLNEEIDFSFVLDIVKDNYCHNNGAMAKDPILMFKLLFLKAYQPLSDADLMKRARTDLRYKFFLGLNPEDEVPDSSLLTYFRKLRLKDDSVLNRLIAETIKLAKDKGVLKSKTVIVDSTHTKSVYNPKTKIEILENLSSKVRKSVYKLNEEYKHIMPQKPQSTDIQDHLDYCKRLSETIRNNVDLDLSLELENKINYLDEVVEDNIQHRQSVVDCDARIGHKSANSSFFGYKTHIAMSGDRIITAANVSSGDIGDAKYAIDLLDESIQNGFDVDTYIGDAAYSAKTVFEYGKEKGIEILAKINPSVYREPNPREFAFTFNKDAQMLVCPAGHMAIDKSKSKDNRCTFTFSKTNCFTCMYKEQCNSTNKDKKVKRTIRPVKDQALVEYQKTNEYKVRYKERYKIEAKNSELKLHHGLDKSYSRNIHGMTIQSAMTIFMANIKRIYKICDEEC